MDKREFYAAVAAILGVEDTFVEKLPYKRRWGQRSLGNGRYEGFGIVRWFGPTCIHVATPAWSGQFNDSGDALEAIRRNGGSA